MSGGNVGIGTTSPQAKLQLGDPTQGPVSGTAGENSLLSFNDRYAFRSSGPASESLHLDYFNSGWVSTPAMTINRVAGNVGIGTASPSARLDVAGTVKATALQVNGATTTGVLTITGGADLAEPFPISGGDIPKGAVLVIDPRHPGQLKQSERAYDKRVAGIVSGANGIQPGITLHQEGALEGTHHLALSGRVYALADAAHGAIEPGDLLTTSDTPGHAMKVMDDSRAHGAILGKAMTGLAEGRGLVLVLVTLH
jgi:hypothetical protein